MVFIIWFLLIKSIEINDKTENSDDISDDENLIVSLISDESDTLTYTLESELIYNTTYNITEESTQLQLLSSFDNIFSLLYSITETQSTKENHNKKLKPGHIVAIVLCSLLGVGLIITLIVYCIIKNNRIHRSYFTDDTSDIDIISSNSEGVTTELINSKKRLIEMMNQPVEISDSDSKKSFMDKCIDDD
jgi:hypothetical protein